jgi:hypothetical protein
MRTLLISSALFVGLCVTIGGCGGSTATLGDGGGSEDSGTGSDGASGGDAGGGNDAAGGDAGGGTDGGVDCTALKADVDQLQIKATQCCAACQVVQCTVAVDGECCQVSVNSADAPATKAFEAALANYKALCHPVCPAGLCPRAPSDMCGASGTCTP